jgi:DNA-binding Xre family transcriptional regulator
MELSREKVNIVLARNRMSVTQLAEAYGVSRARINVILNSRNITFMCAGRLAEALKCDVTEIIEN